MAKRSVRRNNRGGRFFGGAAPATVAVTVAVTVWSSELALEVILELSGVEAVCLGVVPFVVRDTVTSELVSAIVDPDSITAEPDSITVEPETIRVEPYSSVVPCGLAVEAPVPVGVLVCAPIESVAVGGSVLVAVPVPPL